MKGGQSLILKLENYQQWYKKLEADKEQLKKDNAELVRLQAKAEARFEVISEKYDKMIEALRLEAAKGR